MTQFLVAGGLGRVFRGSTDAAAHQKLLARQFEEQRLRRERRDDIESEQSEMIDLALTIITAEDADAFRLELDTYDTATIEALQQNEIALTLARTERDRIFAEAHVLGDGRRVFKTKDGLRVFDESGQELKADVIDADEIDDARPRWETARPIIETYKELVKERSEILDYQAKLDSARERLDAGDMTRKEFHELRDELQDDMPDAVREHVAGMEPVPGQSKDAEATVPGEDLDIPDDMALSPMKLKAATPSFNG